MHIKRIHEMVEKLTECTLSAINENKSNVGDFAIPDVADMIKDLCEAEKSARIAKEMEKCEEEDEAEEKYIRKMLKEENKDEYKRMREEYGEDEGERRFYDNYRYKSSGRFAPKGRGSYRPRSSGRRGRRGYEEPMYFLPPEIYMNYSPEELRDMDRDMGRMYYGGGSGGSSSGGSGSQSGGSGMSGGNMGGNSGGSSSRGYEEYQRGYSEGRSDGYNQGRNDGRNSQSRDYREGRSGTSRRGYMESRENHKDNTPESKQANMKELEKYMKSLSEDLTEAIEGASNEEKTMLKSKLQTLVQKIQ